MKGLSLTQPWATLVAIGAKRIETRSWRTNYRGSLAIHASAGFPGDCRALCREPAFMEALRRAGINGPADLPRGAIVGMARLVDIATTEQLVMVGRVSPEAGGTWELTPREREFGNYGPERYGWLLRPIGRLADPIPWKGSLGLWDVPPDLQRQILDSPAAA